MENRILIKVKVQGEAILIKTISRKFKAPYYFCILKERILELADCNWMVVTDSGSFAVLSLEKTVDNTSILRITFSWLSEEGNGAITGRREYVVVMTDFIKCHYLHMRMWIRIGTCFPLRIKPRLG